MSKNSSADEVAKIDVGVDVEKMSVDDVNKAVKAFLNEKYTEEEWNALSRTTQGQQKRIANMKVRAGDIPLVPETMKGSADSELIKVAQERNALDTEHMRQSTIIAPVTNTDNSVKDESVQIIPLSVIHDDPVVEFFGKPAGGRKALSARGH